MAPVVRRRALAMLAAGWGAMASADGSTSPQTPPPLRPTGSTESSESTDRLLLWVDLDLPELASLPSHRRAERAALRTNILAQQDAVMARLRELGATEEGRLQQVRNALAVRLPGAALDAARRIPGVRGLRAVRHLHREPPSSRN